MLKRILSFIGWAIAAFFAIGALALATSGQFMNALGILLWSLIFVPPVYKITSRFGIAKNIVGRLVVFILMPVVLASCSPTSEVVEPTKESTPSAVVSPAPLPTPSPQNPTPEPSPTESPIPKPAVKEKPSPISTPVKPASSKPLVQSKPLVPQKPLAGEKKQSQAVTPKPKPTVSTSKPNTPVKSGTIIPEQSGSCKDIKAKGFSDIDVKANPWAKRLDRDNDGIACESR